MRYYIFLFTILITFLMPISTEAEDMVSVKLINYIGETSDLTIRLKGVYKTLDPTIQLKEGVKYTLVIEKGSLYLVGEGEKRQKLNESLILIPYKYDYDHKIFVNNRPYLGAMKFDIEKGKYIRPVNQLLLEDYLKGVVPLEVFASWGLETLKAQTLAARTYAASKLDQIIDDTIAYQVYGGYSWDQNTTKAVNETKGEVITYNKQLIETFYSASNGGITENNTNVWGGSSKRYFPIKEDPYDPGQPWNFTLNEIQIDLGQVNWDHPKWWDQMKEKDEEITTTMKNWLRKNGYPGEIKIISIPTFKIAKDRLESERSIKGSITITFLHRLIEGTVLYEHVALNNVPLNHIRPMIGGNVFKSYLIDSFVKNNGKYTVEGRGFGHGVGMSQWGAYVMGEKGKNYRQIIQFYYPETIIRNIEKRPW